MTKREAFEAWAAYRGAMDELYIWKRRALGAEASSRQLKEKFGAYDHLKMHAVEGLCQLGYTVKDGELFPPDHLHKLMEAAQHPLASTQQAEEVPAAMKVVLEAMRSDPDYAWSWHCNVAMAFVDAGGDHYTANQGAARFMQLLAGVEPAHELPEAPSRPRRCRPALWLTVGFAGTEKNNSTSHN